MILSEEIMPFSSLRQFVLRLLKGVPSGLGPPIPFDFQALLAYTASCNRWDVPMSGVMSRKSLLGETRRCGHVQYHI